MAVIRSQTYVHLIVEPVQLFNGNMLPTTREVLQVYYHHHNNEKLSKTESVTVTVREVCEIWARARVPSAEERNIIHKLKLLVDKHRTVCRNKTCGGTAQMARESNFEADMNGLFDISHHDAMNRIKIEEDRVFLADQRTERKYVMGKIDQQLTAVEGRRAVSDTQGQTQQKRAKISVNEAVSPQLAAALDRTSVSNRDAAYILHAAATTYGQNASGMSLSVSSIRRTRSKHRTQAAADVNRGQDKNGILFITASEHETSSERPIKYTGKEELGDKKLDYFIGSRSHFFFQVLNLDKSLLNLSVEQWQQLEAYQHAKVVAHSLKVVNNSAERGIALATNFNQSLTKKEDEKQYLYQVVESHRKQYPDAKKATLKSINEQLTVL
ncbi:hypothetical protein Bpfe_012202 [Biomphalaria pfeifferi]|uniref:Uncharacterized protein n=1 Tax=Biomphalaria pfeifferi TaxID=112525 RepID=A0AAD8BPJ6_BIOPF|nr:hypothetical protein Bpfe_012202 [Biomphalaria pfeifferi]